jgi:hypothetical protein
MKNALFGVKSVQLPVRDIDSTSKPLEGMFLNLILEAFSKKYRKIIIFNHMDFTASSGDLGIRSYCSVVRDPETVLLCCLCPYFSSPGSNILLQPTDGRWETFPEATGSRSLSAGNSLVFYWHFDV